MTISSTTLKNSFSGNGSTTDFTYTYPINSATELSVIIKTNATGVETIKTINSHYTVALAGDSGGTVTFTSGNIPTSAETIFLIRNTTKNQGTDLIENDPFSAEGLENSFDNLQMQIQEVSEAVDRSFKIGKTNSITSAEILTSAADRANKILSFDSSGNLLLADVSDGLDTLGEMTDVTITSVADNEVIAYDSTSSQFINQTAAEAGLIAGGAVTTITSLLATDIKIGEDDQTKIDFETADEIHLYAANAEQVYVADGIFGPQTDSDVDLGSTGVRWKDAYIDSITTTGNVVVGGDLTVTGDDITMGTNTAGHLLIADGTNFNSVAATSLTEISTVANDDVFLAVDTSGGGLKKITRSTIVSGLAVGGVALSNVVEDTTPQLGGNLEMNGKDIVTTSNADLELAPHGTGHVTVKGNTNSGAIQFNCESNSHGQIVKSQPHSASVTNVLTLPAGADSTLVSLVSTDTLTNKTLTSPVLNTGVSGTAVKDEDNMASNSATHLATQQSIKAYVDAVTTSLNAQDLDVSDGSSAIGIDLDTETLGILGGTGLTSAASGNNVTLSVDASQTQITAVGTIATGVWQGTAIASAYIAADAITGAKIADDAINSEHYTDGSIDTAHIADDQITQAKVANDAIGADELASNAVVNASVASGAAIAFSKMADLTASRALVSDGSGDVSVSAVTSTEVGYLDGVTSAVQTQLDAKASQGFAIAMAVAL